MNIGIVSYSLASLGYFMLAGLMLISWRGRPLGGVVIVAALATLAWGGLSVVLAAGWPIPSLLVQLAEFVRNISWLLVLMNMLYFNNADGQAQLYPRKWIISIGLGLVVILGVLFVVPLFAGSLAESLLVVLRDARLVIWLVMPLLALLLIEQVLRQSSSNERWVIKYLCVGVGLIFGFDFLMYADALLYKRINPVFWEARGFVVLMAMPMIAVAIARNPGYDIRIHVSRDAVFHSATIMGAGLYLLLMAIGGYLIQLTGVSFSGAMQIVFLFAAGALLVVLLLSDAFRAKVRVFLTKHFFSFKHDYREQWLGFTEAMSIGGGKRGRELRAEDVGAEEEVPARVVRALAGLVESSGGLLFEKTDQQLFRLSERCDMAEIGHHDYRDLNSLYGFLAEQGWVVDFDEYISSPDLYQGLELPAWLLQIRGAWLIVPLQLREDVIGFVVIKRSGTHISINWEDRDLLKMAGKQAAIHLAQYQADKSLMEAHQFDSFNRLSAYVIHDLKNILAQQSLLLKNAEKHRDNPEFVDDAFLTIENSVNRMQRLMAQMRDGMRGDTPENVDLSVVLRAVAEGRAVAAPLPNLECDEAVMVHADPGRLKTVFSHIVQNAQEATPDSGSVSVRLSSSNGVALVEIADSGTGMSEEFIRDRLFKAFDSTKGLMGMGIGVYESREYVRALGGDISVTSVPEQGTHFRISLPAV